LDPEHGTDPTTLMHRADVAMYVAKNAERGYEVYSEETDAGRPGAAWPARRAAQAPPRSVLLHFQPQVEIPSGRRGIERWCAGNIQTSASWAQGVRAARRGGNAAGRHRWVLGAAVRQCKAGRRPASRSAWRLI
jgi:predicted signal transduction protein with EAL and GGDEF domain